MVKNTLTATAVLSSGAAACATRPLAESGQGAFARAGAWIGGGYPAGIAGGAGKASGSYVPGVVDPIRRPRIRFTATNGSTVQSAVQHNTMALLNPVYRGGVGLHPARERTPA
jgi:hypothetical protein